MQNCSATLKKGSFMNHTISFINHCVKSVQIRSFFWSGVSLHIQSKCGKIWTIKISVFGHFSRSDYFSKSQNKARKSETGRIWRSCWYCSEWNYNTNYIIVSLYHSHYITVYYDYISIILHHDCIIGRNVVSCSARQQSIFTLSKSLAAPEDLSMIRGFEIKTWVFKNDIWKYLAVLFYNIWK